MTRRRRTTGRRSSPRFARRIPTLVFIAEAYWDMEWTLQQQGFDFCYDKRLYDRLVSGPARVGAGHLQAAADYQERLLRFIENHDEPRAADTFAPEQRARGRGRHVDARGRSDVPRGPARGAAHPHPRVPRARPAAAADRELRAFYETLLGAVADSDLRDGEWQLCECSGWPDNHSAEPPARLVLARGRERHLVVVNLAAETGRRRSACRGATSRAHAGSLRDALDGDVFERDGDEMQRRGPLRRDATVGVLLLRAHRIKPSAGRSAFPPRMAASSGRQIILSRWCPTTPKPRSSQRPLTGGERNMAQDRSWSGWIGFAAVLLLVVGMIDIFQGLIAIIRGQYYAWPPGQIIIFDLKTWGWITLFWGIVAVLAALGLASGQAGLAGSGSSLQS